MPSAAAQYSDFCRRRHVQADDKIQLFNPRVPTMTTDEQMNAICIRIQDEKDRQRFEALLADLYKLVDQKRLRFSASVSAPPFHSTRPWKRVSGTAQRIVTDVYQTRGQEVEIVIEGAEHLFREIRIENTFTDAGGKAVALKRGARVDLTFEADAQDTVKKTADGRA